MFLQLLLYYTIIGNSFGTQRKKYVKRIFWGCVLQNTGKMCIRTEGLLYVVGMKLEGREAFVVKEREGLSDLADRQTNAGVGKEGYSAQ
jgi:hypothetical protein